MFLGNQTKMQIHIYKTINKSTYTLAWGSEFKSLNSLATTLVLWTVLPIAVYLSFKSEYSFFHIIPIIRNTGVFSPIANQITSLHIKAPKDNLLSYTTLIYAQKRTFTRKIYICNLINSSKGNFL